jgi:hypothetical protein
MQAPEFDTHEDALVKALFADAARPPMGDERFTAGVMRRVEADIAKARSRWTVAIVGVGALAVAAAVSHFGAVAGALADVYAGYAGQAASLGAGASALLVAAAATAAALIYAERG